jgi:hypothetical protein
MSVNYLLESGLVNGSAEPTKHARSAQRMPMFKYSLSELVMTHIVTPLRPCHGREPVTSAVCLQQRIIQRTLGAQEFMCHSKWRNVWRVQLWNVAWSIWYCPINTSASNRGFATENPMVGDPKPQATRGLRGYLLSAAGLKRLPIVGYGTLQGVKLN